MRGGREIARGATGDTGPMQTLKLRNTTWLRFLLTSILLSLLTNPAHAISAVGDFPWITLLCKYPDISDEPRSAEFVQELFGDDPGQINHFWKQASYGKSSLDGSEVLGWYTLPRPRAAYFISGEADASLLVRDCARAADADVDFSAFFGINVFTNGPWTNAVGGTGTGGAGGRIFTTLDGKDSHGFTTIGVNGWDDHGLVVHEMGHGFGLRHGNNYDHDDDEYDSPWTIMSSVHGYSIPHSRYGNLAKHFNAYEKESLGWIDDTEILELDLDTLAVGTSQRLTITGLGRSSNASGSYRMLKLTRGGSEGDFYYTLEARERVGQYEAALPDSGVIIHEVDLQTRRAAWVIDSQSPAADYASSQGVIWKVGEIYRGDGFNLEITSQVASGFEVAVTGTNGAVGGNNVPFIRPFARIQQAAVDDLFQLYLFPVDPDGFPPDVISSDLPQGASLVDNGDGVWIFQWRPLLSDVGVSTVTFEAVDAFDENLRASQSLQLEIIEGKVSDAGPVVSTAPGQPRTLKGSVPWVTLLCKFSDVDSFPASAAFVRDMFGDGSGQINHWWKEVSYNRMNIDGSVVLGWYELPGARGDYVSGDVSADDIDDDKLTRDCLAAADDDVDYSRFYGVNTFYNSAFNSHGIGFGKARTVYQDEAGLMATTAISEPAWTRQTSVIHEMSLAVGLPLANNSDRDDNTYDNPWTNMSDGQGYAVPDLRYDYVAKHLNAFEKYSLGWLEPDEVTELRVDTLIPGGLSVRLTPLGNTDPNPQQRAVILRDPMRSDSVFYVLEARESDGPYDGNLPGSAVIVHEIDLLRSEPAWSVYDTSDGSTPLTYAYTDNDMWTVGETLLIPGASITVSSRTNRGFNLYIQTGLERVPSNSTIGDGIPNDNVASSPLANPQERAQTQVLGTQPWVTLLCKFADDPVEPASIDFVRTMFGDEPGQLNHYWAEQSYGRMNIDGSKVWGWYVLPGARSDYVTDEEISSAMYDDCISLADRDVNFSEFYGVNTFFNGAFNDSQSSTGGKKQLSQDEAGIRGFTAVSAPSWTWQAAIAHEMARGMGLTLTNNYDDDDNSYDNPWTLMSDSRAYANIDPDLKYIGKHINAHDKEQLGWLDTLSIYDLKRTYLNNGTTLEIELDALGEKSAGNNRAIKFGNVTDGKGTVYYLEARVRGGIYDGSLPGSGVLIHEIVPDRYEPAWLYFDPAAGRPSDYSDTVDDVWTEGEQVLLDGVEVTVARRTSTGFVLRFHSEYNYFPPSEDSSGGTDSDNSGTTDNNGGNPSATEGSNFGAGNGGSSGVLVASNPSVGSGGGLLWLPEVLILWISLLWRRRPVSH